MSLLRASIALASLVWVADASPVAGAVVADATKPNGLRYVPGATSGLAWGTYDAQQFNISGWAILDLHADDGIMNDTLTSYAIGYLEGVLTAADMSVYASNTGADQPNSDDLQKFLDDNLAWMRSQVLAWSARDPYWQHVGALLAQVQGLADGSQDPAAEGAPGSALPVSTVYNAIIQGGDIFNLAGIYGVSPAQLKHTGVIKRLARTGKLDHLPLVQQWRAAQGLHGVEDSKHKHGSVDHCSALVKLVPGNLDIWIAHTTWSGFEHMQRILKRYDLALPGAQGGIPVPGRHTAVSSYPSMLQYSSDDYYVMSSGIISTETTINNDNQTLAEQYASTEVVLEWARNVLANRLAVDGPTWVSTFSRYASGTYTNSWMILNTNLFTPGTVPPPGTLTVAEEMPGYIAVHDRTPWLVQNGYWGSYNIPSDPFIFNISGQQALVDRYGGPDAAGAFFTFANTSRANIFRRDQGKVVDEASMRAMIRYNDYQHDPFSTLGCGSNPPSSASNAIADRSDLNPAKGDYIIRGLGFGDAAGIDAKVSSASWMKAAALSQGVLPISVQSGPTYDQQPVFVWSNSSLDSQVPHTGLPDVWNFAWLQWPFGI